MAKKRQAASIRRGGQRFEVYNEGLCVYLHDEGNADRLRELIQKKGNSEVVFYSNLLIPPFSKAVAAGKLALAYELQQDDEVHVEVIVGHVLTDKELSVSRWLQVQRGKLNLPTGRLRIDTPNTMPLDPDAPGDRGAVADVPPGEYALSLYRVDWEACERESIRHKGPDEVIVLTPIDEAEPISIALPILPFPEPVQETSWIGAYAVHGKRFECQVNFWDYWEWIRINLEADAVAKLSLTCGSIMRLHAARMSFDLVFLDEMSRQSYFLRYGRKDFNAKIGNRTEVAIGGWQEFQGRRILSFFRHTAAKAVPVKYHEIWIPATGEVLSESCPPPEEARLPAARRTGNAVHAAVAHANDDLMIINATEKEFDGMGKTLKLSLPYGVHSVALGKHDRKSLSVFLTGKGVPKGLHYLKAMGLRAFAREGKIPKTTEELKFEIVRAKERQPMVGYFPPATTDPLSVCLHVQPMNIDGNQVGFDWPAPPAIGTPVELTH